MMGLSSTSTLYMCMCICNCLCHLACRSFDERKKKERHNCPNGFDYRLPCRDVTGVLLPATSLSVGERALGALSDRQQCQLPAGAAATLVLVHWCYWYTGEAGSTLQKYKSGGTEPHWYWRPPAALPIGQIDPPAIDTIVHPKSTCSLTSSYTDHN